MKKIGFIIKVVFILLPVCLTAQNNDRESSERDSLKVFEGHEKYLVEIFDQSFNRDIPKNIILMIGDGMGVSHVFAGLVANGGHLFLENFKHIGFSKTHSANRFVTDSGAGGTALATGQKTYNSAISMAIDASGDTVPARTVLEAADEKGLSTGLVATCAMSHATPASFIAHQPSRNMYDAIGADYLETDIDVFIGAGYKNFGERADGRNLIEVLEQKGYRVLEDMDKIAEVKEGKLAGLTDFAQPLPYGQRTLDLPISTETAINILSKNEKGFFMMVEGSQIDWASHENNTTYLVQEMLDFDRAIGKALEFAANDKETLIVVTADHETGGFAVLRGDYEKGVVHGGFISGGHTGVMVPVFSYGPGAEHFTGIMDNTDIAKKIFSFLENQTPE